MNKYVIRICWFFVAYWLTAAIVIFTTGYDLFSWIPVFDGNDIVFLVIFALALLTLLSDLVAKYAQNKGRSYWKYFIFSFLLSPIISFIVAAVSRPSEEYKEKSALKRGGKKCPACAEVVKADAKICKHCRSDLSAI